MSDKDEQENADVAKTLGLDRSSDHGRLGWRWPLAGGMAVLIILGLLVFLQNGDSAIRYKTSEVQQGNLTITVTATGTLEPVNQVDVGSELSGIIASVEVDYNDRVELGQVLAQLDTDKLQAEVLQSQAALEAAQAKVLEVKATVLETQLKSQRCEELAARKMCSQEDVDSSLVAHKRARAEEGSARAQVAEARAKLGADQTDLAKAVIHSPIVREQILAPMIGQQLALLFSGILLSIFIFLITLGMVSFLKVSNSFGFWLIGAFWVLLTLTFEFGFGHYINGEPWDKLFEVFNILEGDLFILVLFITAVSPYIAAKIRALV